MWLSELVGRRLQGQAPAGLASYTTMFTHGLDIAVITPASILAGVLLLRRDLLSYVLAFPMLCLCLLIGLVILAQVAAAAIARSRKVEPACRVNRPPWRGFDGFNLSDHRCRAAGCSGCGAGRCAGRTAA